MACDDHAAVRRIAAARSLYEAGLREVLVGEPVVSSSGAFLRYVLARIGSSREENVLAIYLTRERLYIAEEVYKGSAAATSRIPVRHLVRRALGLDAQRLIIAHNHPSGKTVPSQRDIAATRELLKVLRALDILLDDHCIATPRKVSSMKAQGLL